MDLGGATGIPIGGGGTGDAEAGLGSAAAAVSPDELGLGVAERAADRGSRSAKGSVK